MITKSKIKRAVLTELTKIVGKSGFANSELMRVLYGRDLATEGTLELKEGTLTFPPDVIVWPTTLEQVVALVKLAAKHHLPIIPFGGGSGVCGGTLAVNGGLILDLKRMKKIVSMDTENGTADIESGIIGMDLERQLNDKGYSMHHFPASILCATLGGFLATRSAGQFSSKYGKIEDMVVDVEAVLPDGTLKKIGKPLPSYKKVDPVSLLVGSEGTLGVITKARMKISPLPKRILYRALSFNRITSGLETMRHILQSGIRPSVLRLYDPLDSLLLQMGYESGAKDSSKFVDALEDLVVQYLPVSKMRDYSFRQLLRFPQLMNTFVEKVPTDVTLILGFEGRSEWITIEERLSLDIAKRFICRDLGEGPGRHWYQHRYSIAFKMPTIFQMGCFVDTMEVATTWDNLEHLYKAVRKTIGKHALVMAHFSHAYHEGCSIYFTFVGYGGGGEKDRALFRKTWQEAMKTCLAAGGTLSHHHGIGLLKSGFMEEGLGPLMPLWRDIKRTLDPKNIMNPGKMGLD